MHTGYKQNGSEQKNESKVKQYVSIYVYESISPISYIEN